MAVGDYLRRQRLQRGMSLRDVQHALNELKDPVSLSSGHLSLIEQGKVRTPEPKTLNALARALGLEYLELMVEAGHLPAATLKDQPSSPSLAFRGADRLDPEQIKEVEDFISFLRSRKRTRRGTRE